MSSQETPPPRPDFGQGVPAEAVEEGRTIAGHVSGQAVLLSRLNGQFFAIGAVCSHYGGPLAKGACRRGVVRCPWHHARFDLKTGEALDAPAMTALDRWRVEVEGGVVFVREPLLAEPRSATRPKGAGPKRIVIVGGGAAGFAAADALRKRDYDGEIVMLSADEAAPCDRPNLSKDYLAGTAPAEWLPLAPPEFYSEKGVDLRLGVEVGAIDPARRQLALKSGEIVGYDALLLASGAEPIRLATPGFDRPNVHVLRTLADSEAIIAAALSGRRAAVIGASFIGLEAAAALRTRGLEVDVIAPDAIPLGRIMGPEIGGYVQGLHEAHGVRFHLGQTAAAFDGRTLSLANGERLEVDLVVLGVGVRPRVELAEAAGLTIDRGVLVDRHMQTSVAGIFAAGDIARYPSRAGAVRIEHWVVAERQGQVAAANLLGERTPYVAPPFFWSHHYNIEIRYTGHAERWDRIEIDGSFEGKDVAARFVLDGRVIAAATLGRDRENLEIEAGLADFEAA
jgi:NADPH-dependent 2,4-dienoyl-CoA reductase/sulfur reductase-like enzyme/nitrite reductase/ring-hydroxylating ferredoxin subunit